MCRKEVTIGVSSAQAPCDTLGGGQPNHILYTNIFRSLQTWELCSVNHVRSDRDQFSLANGDGGMLPVSQLWDCRLVISM